LKANEGNYLLLTPNTPNWDPHSDIYQDQEYAMVDYNGNIKSDKYNKSARVMNVQGLRSSIINGCSYDLISCPECFISSVSSLTNDYGSSSIGEHQMKGIISKGSQHSIDPRLLSQRWNIPLEMAKRTLRVTSQIAMRMTDNRSLNRKYRTNDRMLRYSRLDTNTYMDTMFASKRIGKSTRGNSTCQVFVTEFGHIFVVLMEGKSGKTIAS